MKKRAFFAIVLAVALVVMPACSTTAPEPPSSSAPTSPAPASSAPASSAASSEQSSTADAGSFDGTVTFGVVAPMTGTNIMVGDYVVNGAKMAAKHINENGGILGKELKLVFEDEVDNLQASVNAMTKIMEYEEVVAFFGSTYSSYCIGVSPAVLEKKIPMFAGGSSANIPKENNPYVWQVRMTDDQTGKLVAKALTEVLGAKNPAIMFVSDSFGQGLQEQTVAALAELGITVPESNLYGYASEEVNYSPLITQIQNSDVDSVFAISHQMPAAIICQQVDAAGLDIPKIGSSSYASVVCRENAGTASDDWYSITDWTVNVTTDAGKAFASAYLEEYGMESDMPAVTAYDSIMVFAKACEIAGTTEDREAINDALYKIENFPGAMSTYSYAENHCFATTQFLTQNKDGLANMIEAISAR